MSLVPDHLRFAKPSCCGPGELHIQMVASPRNQLNRHERGRPFPATFSFVGQQPTSRPDSLSARSAAGRPAESRRSLQSAHGAFLRLPGACPRAGARRRVPRPWSGRGRPCSGAGAAAVRRPSSSWAWSSSFRSCSAFMLVLQLAARRTPSMIASTIFSMLALHALQLALRARSGRRAAPSGAGSSPSRTRGRTPRRSPCASTCPGARAARAASTS